jgi:hypothetical protein
MASARDSAPSGAAEPPLKLEKSRRRSSAPSWKVVHTEAKSLGRHQTFEFDLDLVSEG